MSQAGFLKANLPPHPVGVVETLTGNAGGAVGPNILNNINIVGTNPITVTGTPLTNTETITIATATTAQIGATTLATDAETIAGAVSTHAVTPTSLKAKLGTQTVDGIAYGNGQTNALDWTAAGTNGQVLIAATLGAPAFATLTSTGGTIAFTPGANTLNLEASPGAGDTYPTDSGTATPSAGVLNVLTQNASLGCGSSVLFSAPGPSNTIQLNVTDARNSTFIGKNAGDLAATTNDAVGLGYNALHATTGAHYSVAIGYAALSSVTTSQGNSALGANSLAALTTAAGNVGNNTAIGQNTGVNLTTGQYNSLFGSLAGSQYTTSESSNICVNNIGTNGESNVIRIGTQGAGAGQQNTCYVAGITGVNVGSVAAVVSIATGTGQLGTTTITAGTGISVTPGPKILTIAATGSSGLAWSVITADQGAVANNGYICNKAGLLTLLLPAVSSPGDYFRVAGMNTALGWKIAQNAGNQIFYDAANTTAGITGYLASSAICDSVELVCITANANWQVVGSTGNITYA